MPKSRYLFYYNHLVCETLILSRDLQTIMQLPQLRGAICTASTTTSRIGPFQSTPYLATPTTTALGSQSTVLAKGALEIITGQRAKITRAKKSIAAFNLRKGGVVGCMVTLRRSRFHLFLDQVVTCILPQLADPSLTNSFSMQLQHNNVWGIHSFLEFSQLQPFFPQFENTKGCNIDIMINAKKIKSPFRANNFFRNLLG